MKKQAKQLVARLFWTGVRSNGSGKQMYGDLDKALKESLTKIQDSGLYKRERALSTAQSSHIATSGREVLNFCANNYLGLANNPKIIAAASAGMLQWGFGMASVRFICGTQDIHLELEAAVSNLLQTEATILFSSCFDANGGIFEALFTEEDAIISDELNHASLIDGIRLSKAGRHRYRNRDLVDLEQILQATQSSRQRIIVTDGVFSMDGYLAPLPEICDLAEKYNALVMVDDSHAVGFIGASGGGTPEYFGVVDRVDIVTGTFGKALGGAAGGYVSGRKAIVEMLRQKARPYLFSNSLPPAIVIGTLTAIELVKSGGALRDQLQANAAYFRELMSQAGFELRSGSHPIIPVMFGDAHVATAIASEMLNEGIFVTAFSYPVVPLNAARIRVQLSAAHSRADIERCVRAFIQARSIVDASTIAT